MRTEKIRTIVEYRENPGHFDCRIPGAPYLVPALWQGLSQATERDSVLARPQSKSRIFALWKRWNSSAMRPVFDQPQCASK